MLNDPLADALTLIKNAENAEWLRTDPELQSLRDRPDFQRLLPEEKDDKAP